MSMYCFLKKEEIIEKSPSTFFLPLFISLKLGRKKSHKLLEEFDRKQAKRKTKKFFFLSLKYLFNQNTDG